jgi:hypothetical protein
METTWPWAFLHSLVALPLAARDFDQDWNWNLEIGLNIEQMHLIDRECIIVVAIWC